MSSRTRATKNPLAWNETKLAAALQNQHYMKVTSNQGTLVLTGAQKRWEKDPTFTYIPHLRVAGTAAEVRAYLTDPSRGLTADNIAEFLSEAYTLDSVSREGTIRDRFAAELEEASRVGKALREAERPAMTQEKFERLCDAIIKNDYKIEKVSSTGKSGASRKGRSGGSRKKALADRLANLADGKVLDVSDYDSIKSITRPGPASAKIGPVGVAIVSSKPENFARAMNELGGEYLRFIQAYEDLSRKGKALPQPSAVRASSPVRSSSPARAASPARAGSPARAASPPPVSVPRALPTRPAAGPARLAALRRT